MPMQLLFLGPLWVVWTVQFPDKCKYSEAIHQEYASGGLRWSFLFWCFPQIWKSCKFGWGGLPSLVKGKHFLWYTFYCSYAFTLFVNPPPTSRNCPPPPFWISITIKVCFVNIIWAIYNDSIFRTFKAHSQVWDHFWQKKAL